MFSYVSLPPSPSSAVEITLELEPAGKTQSGLHAPATTRALIRLKTQKQQEKHQPRGARHQMLALGAGPDAHISTVINKPLGKRVVSAVLHSRVAFMAKQPEAPAAAQGFFPITCRDAAAPRPSHRRAGRGGMGTRSCSYTIRATA